MDEIACLKGFNLLQDLNALWLGDREAILCGKVEIRDKSPRASHEGPHEMNQRT